MHGFRNDVEPTGECPLVQALRTCVGEGIEGWQRLYDDVVSEDLNW